MNMIKKFREELIKLRRSVKDNSENVKRIRKDFSSYKDKGAFELQDIFYMFVAGIMIYVFTVIWNPILALFNFSNIAYGSTVELILDFFVLIIAAGFVASMVKKWQTPSM